VLKFMGRFSLRLAREEDCDEYELSFVDLEAPLKLFGIEFILVA
jgi:hypothetical protein